MTVSTLYEQVERECKALFISKLKYQEYLHVLEDLKNYSILRQEGRKQEVPNNRVLLNVEIEDLAGTLEKIEKANEDRQDIVIVDLQTSDNCRQELQEDS